MTRVHTLIAMSISLVLFITVCWIAGGETPQTAPEQAPAVSTASTYSALSARDDLPSRASRTRPVPTPSPQAVEKVAPHTHVSRVTRPAKVKATRPARLRASVGGRVYDITMYCPTGNRTASGKWPRRGMVATISRAIPFGTVVHIEGLGDYVVEDRIGHGSDFDLFTPSCSEARAFGRKHRKVNW